VEPGLAVLEPKLLDRPALIREVMGHFRVEAAQR